MRKFVLIGLSCLLMWGLTGCGPQHTGGQTGVSGTMSTISDVISAPSEYSSGTTSTISDVTSIPKGAYEVSSTENGATKAEATAQILKRATNHSADKIITHAYPEQELIESLKYWRSDNMNTMLQNLDKKYPVECIRCPDDGEVYCIYNLKEGGRLFVFFHGEEDEDGKALKFADYIFVVKKALSKEDFNCIKEGDGLAKVEAIDPGTQVINSIKSGYLIKAKTCHMVKEGFIEITYKSEDYDPTTFQYNPATYQVDTIRFIPNGGQVYSYSGVLGGENPVPRTYRVLPQDYPQ